MPVITVRYRGGSAEYFMLEVVEVGNNERVCIAVAAITKVYRPVQHAMDYCVIETDDGGRWSVQHSAEEVVAVLVAHKLVAGNLISETPVKRR